MTMSLGPNLGLLVDGAAAEQHFVNLMAQFRGLDGLIQPHVKDKDLATPPGSPANGDMYIVAASPTGAWASQAGKLARWYVIPANGSNGASGTSGWQFFTPRIGWFVRVEDELDGGGACKRYSYTGSDWVEEVASGGGGGISLAAVVTEATTSRNLGLSDINTYLRFTNAGASTCTITPQSSVTWTANAEIHIRRAAAADLTLTPGSGVTLNAPNGGTLVMSNAMSVTLKRVAADEWDVIGQTVAL
jgi:hypothetical protein